MSPRRRGWSDITVTDQFCGAGGSSIGAAAEGLRIRMAMNHWQLAVETHNTNFPDTDHDVCDISSPEAGGRQSASAPIAAAVAH